MDFAGKTRSRVMGREEGGEGKAEGGRRRERKKGEEEKEEKKKREGKGRKKGKGEGTLPRCALCEWLRRRNHYHHYHYYDYYYCNSISTFTIHLQFSFAGVPLRKKIVSIKRPHLLA